MLELPRYSECNVVFALSYLHAPLALTPTQPLNLAHTITHPSTLGVCVCHFMLKGKFIHQITLLSPIVGYTLQMI